MSWSPGTGRVTTWAQLLFERVSSPSPRSHAPFQGPEGTAHYNPADDYLTDDELMPDIEDDEVEPKGFGNRNQRPNDDPGRRRGVSAPMSWDACCT